jgi:hypothetical protein
MKLKTKTKIGQHPGWCGPSALSILSGRSINHCAKLIATERNRRGYWYNGRGTSKQVKGTHTGELRKALAKMGMTMKEIETPRNYHKHHQFGFPTETVTLRRYMAERGGEQWKSAMLLEVTDHWVVVRKDYVSDSIQSGHYDKHWAKGKKVRAGYIVRTKPKK